VRRLSLGLALCTALASAAEPALPSYPGVANTRIGDAFVVDGLRFQLAYFLTKDSLPEVARYFSTLWRGSGYPVTLDSHLRSEAVISAFLTRESRQWTVALQAYEGMTLGFCVVRDLRSQAASGSGPRPIPAEGVPGGEVVLGDMAQARLTVVTQMEALGFTLIDDSSSRGGPTRTLRWQRGDERLLTVVVSAAGGFTFVLQVPSRVVP